MRERLPELNELATFLAAAEERSIARAAKLLHISTPSAVKRIDNLEAVLGKKLLERGNRGVTMTADGRELYPRAVRLVLDARGIARDPVDHDDRLQLVRELNVDLGLLVDRLFRLVPTPIAITRLEDAVVLAVNDAFCRLVGRPRADVLGRSPFDGHEASVPSESPLRYVGARLQTATGVARVAYRSDDVQLGEHVLRVLVFEDVASPSG